MQPAQPGAWQWLGRRVLQFRPAEPWTPLRPVTLTAAGRSATLLPLLPEPVATAPDDVPEGIAGLDTISLTFAQPVDAAALARLLTIELRPLPGIDATGAQTLTAADFTIRALERRDRADRQTYLVVLHQPLPDQRLAILRLRLSDAPGLDDPIFELRLHTATAVRVQYARLRRRLYGRGRRRRDAVHAVRQSRRSRRGHAPAQHRAELLRRRRRSST